MAVIIAHLNMPPTPRVPLKRSNLLLAFDAFGTLYTPKASVFAQYTELGRWHGIDVKAEDELQKTFKVAYKDESSKHPNYGKADGLGAEKWWANVSFEKHRSNDNRKIGAN